MPGMPYFSEHGPQNRAARSTALKWMAHPVDDNFILK